MIYLATFKLTISDTKGRSITRELKDADANQLIGTSIGTELDAAPLGLSGKLTITGGSDKSGVPMRADVHGNTRKYVMISRGVGLPRAPVGQRIRKLIRGGDITEEIFQVNCKYDGVHEEPKVKDTPDSEKPAKSEKKADSKNDGKDKNADTKTKTDAKEPKPDSKKEA